LNVAQTLASINRTLNELSPYELRQKLGNRSLTLVDVLPQESYAQGHIPRAINLPLAELDSRATEVLPDRDAEIVVYCASDT
jgi:rhodanese-related sulfurtransferase